MIENLSFKQAQKFMSEAQEKAKRANELQAQIQARMASLAGLPAPMKGMPPVKATDKVFDTQTYVHIMLYFTKKNLP